uniref:Uncharacterized protein n=1 Tax=Leersia perrieri TaxID=77586 RepID=A0A0D9V0H8_9ORYZ
MARGHDQLPLIAFLLLFLVQLVPCSLLSFNSAHAATVDTALPGRRLLPAPAAPVLQPQSMQVKVTAVHHPWSMDQRRSGRRSAAMMMAVSKHQVPTGANPDSN